MLTLHKPQGWTPSAACPEVLLAVPQSPVPARPTQLTCCYYHFARCCDRSTGMVVLAALLYHFGCCTAGYALLVAALLYYCWLCGVLCHQCATAGNAVLLATLLRYCANAVLVPVLLCHCW